MDGRITDSALIEISLSQIAFGRKEFEEVEVDIDALESYLIDNLVLPGIKLARIRGLGQFSEPHAKEIKALA